MAHPMQTSFNAGEWSPKMDGQVDHDRYRYACRKMENFIALVQGPAKSRPGTRYVAEAKYTNKDARLIPFIYSDEQAYCLEFGDLYMRVFANRGQIYSGGVPYEIVTPYPASDVWGLDCRAQSADVMYIMHPLHPPMKLSRRGHTAWTLTEIDWNDGPYLSENSDQAIHLSVSAVTGAGITVTAQNMYATTTTGTWAGTPAAAVPVMTVALEKGGFRFQVPTAGVFKSVKLEVVAASVADPDVMSAYLYSDVAGSPGVLLETCDTAQDVHTTGEKTFTFPNHNLTASKWYWICFDASVPDAAITLSAVAHDASYGSGTHATAITSITDNLAAAGEFKVEITYQPTGNPSVFQAGHVGSKWRIRHTGQSSHHVFRSIGPGEPAIHLLGAFTVDVTVNGTWEGHIILESSYNQIQWVRAGSFSTSTKQEFFEPKGAWYRMRCDRYSGGSDGSASTELYQIEHWGSFEITAYTNAHSVTATVINTIGSTDPTAFWREGAWSDVRGYPRTACFRDQRLWLAGTAHQPQTLWGTWVGDYENMAPHTQDDAAVEFDLVDFKSPILWLVSHSSFLAGSSGEEGRLSPRKAEPISATNPIATEIQTTHGTHMNTRPLVVGPAVLFAQKGGHRLREATYALESNAYVATDLNVLAEHILTSSLVDMAYQQEPYSVVWCLTADGDLMGMTYYPVEKVVGWHRHPTVVGDFTSICCAPAYSGDVDETRDELWLIRKVYDSTAKVYRRYIEVMTKHEDITDQDKYFCVDSGLTYYSATVPTAVVTGLDHLAGKTVAICADGAIQAPREVVKMGSSWGVTLDEGTLANRVHVGLPYTCKLIPMRLEAGVQDGTAQGRMKEISSVKVRVLNTGVGKIGPDEDHLVDISPYIEGSYLADMPPELQSGDVSADGWPGDSDYDGNILILQDQPVPMTVVAIMPVVTTND